MRIKLLSLILLLSFNSFFQNAICQNDTKLNKIVIPLGGNTYQTGGMKNELVNNDGISSWKSADAEFSVYFSSTTEKSVTISFNIPEQKGSSKILLSTDGKTLKIDLKAGKSGTIKAGNFQLKKGYNILKLKGITKKGVDFGKIKDLIVEYKGSDDFNFVRNNSDNRFYWGKRGPSVHMSYNLPKDKNIKWFYNEITVPQGYDPVGSYFMANGFGQGYFGIQVNSESERRILFSVWSPTNTDNPKDIPEDEKIKLLKKGEGVKSGEFGNEGSGGQSFMIYNWKAGNKYKFLNSVEPDGKGNTIYTAYFKDDTSENWMLIASFLRPKTNTWYTRPHSFLENFNYNLGYKVRKVMFSNQWACNTNGEWLELNTGMFTGDDIAGKKFRIDFDGGVENNAFFLKNGGFFTSETKLMSQFQRQVTNVPPVIDFTKLP